jgi:hypothetical protein
MDFDPRKFNDAILTDIQTGRFQIKKQQGPAEG